MLVLVVLSMQQFLDLGGLGVELEPLLVRGLADAVHRNASRLQPSTNSVDGAL